MESVGFCQSCGMPLKDPQLFGTNADASPNSEYCKWCYQNGAYTQEMTMEQMIEFCVSPMVENNPGMTAGQARRMMQEFMPQLARWKQAESNR